jgi:hypothetical protein
MNELNLLHATRDRRAKADQRTLTSASPMPPLHRVYHINNTKCYTAIIPVPALRVTDIYPTLQSTSTKNIGIELETFVLHCIQGDEVEVNCEQVMAAAGLDCERAFSCPWYLLELR